MEKTLSKEILFCVKEALLKDRRENLFSSLEKYRGKYIHFTDINKIGVNLRKKHHDPFGVYFYPVDFLLNHEEMVSFGLHSNELLYGMEREHFFICDIDTSEYVNLNTEDYDYYYNIADRNGWSEFMDSKYSDWKESGRIPYGLTSMHRNAYTLPGAFFYSVADMLVNSSKGLYYKEGRSKWTWNTLLKGVKGLVDNKGVIFRTEPRQCVAMDRKTYKVVYSGFNKEVSWKKFAFEDYERVIQEITGGTGEVEIGGHTISLKINKKHARIDFTSKDADKINPIFLHQFMLHTRSNANTREEDYESVRRYLIAYLENLSSLIEGVNDAEKFTNSAIKNLGELCEIRYVRVTTNAGGDHNINTRKINEFGLDVEIKYNFEKESEPRIHVVLPTGIDDIDFNKLVIDFNNEDMFLERTLSSIRYFTLKYLEKNYRLYGIDTLYFKVAAKYIVDKFSFLYKGLVIKQVEKCVSEFIEGKSK